MTKGGKTPKKFLTSIMSHAVRFVLLTVFLIFSIFSGISLYAGITGPGGFGGHGSLNLPPVAPSQPTVTPSPLSPKTQSANSPAASNGNQTVKGAGGGLLEIFAEIDAKKKAKEAAQRFANKDKRAIETPIRRPSQMKEFGIKDPDSFLEKVREYEKEYYAEMQKFLDGASVNYKLPGISESVIHYVYALFDHTNTRILAYRVVIEWREAARPTPLSRRISSELPAEVYFIKADGALVPPDDICLTTLREFGSRISASF